MFRSILCCLWIMILCSAGVNAWAAGKGLRGPAAAIPAQEMAGPGQAREGGEAKELIDKARELMRVGKFEEALPLAQKALEMREKTWGPEHPATAGALMLLGRIYEDQFHYYLALPLYKRALAIREKALGPEHADTAASMGRLAICYVQLGYFTQALPLAQQSLRILEKAVGPEHLDTAGGMIRLAYLYAQMGAHDKALPLAQQALRISEKAPAENPLTASILSNLAMFYAQMGSLDQALPLAQRAAAIRERVFGPEHPQTSVILKTLGFIYLAQKNYSQAESFFRKAGHKQGEQGLVELYLATGRYGEAVSLLQSIGPGPAARPQYQAQYYTQKGQAELGLGHLQVAAVAFLEAIRYIEELRTRSAGERTSFFEAGIISPYHRAYRGMTAALAEMAQKGESPPPEVLRYGPETGAAAFYFAEGIKARALLEAMAAAAGQLESQQLPADLRGKEQQLRERLAALESQREESFQPLLYGGHHRGRRQIIAEFQLKMEGLQRQQQDFVGELRRRFPRYAALFYPQPYKAQELPLKPGEVLLEYVLGDKESYFFRVEPGGRTQVFRLAQGREALEKRLGGLLAPFRKSELRREDLNRFSLSEAAALYQELLAPALSGVAQGTHLIIVPDGVLGAFPLEALVVQAGSGWANSVLVGDRWPVTYSQSAAIMALNRALGLSKATQPLFAVGDCIYRKDSPRYLAYKAGQGPAGELRHAGPEKALTMAAAQRDWGRLDFPPLPETRQTVMDLAKLFGEPAKAPNILLDVLATETQVRKAPLSQYHYLFFGTHGFLADKISGVQEPVLVLTQVENKSPDNGFLTFSKVMQLKLNADVVTLAACMTGVGQVMQGEGVLNFARAFEQAGARSVMVALWNIPVAESLKFYHTFYQALKDGKTRLQALQAARQAVRAEEPHPYFWAGLILHGEG